MQAKIKYSLLLTLILVTLIGIETDQLTFGHDDIPPARKVDEYSKCRQGVPGCINEEDEWARLDSVGNHLRADLSLQTYIIVYAGRHALPGSGLRHANYVRNLLRRWVADDSRVHVIDGGRREHLTVELWLALTSASPPTPSSNVLVESLNSKSAYKFDEIYPEVYKEETALFLEYKHYDHTALMDGFALLLEKEPNLRGYMIAYDGRRDRAGTAFRFAESYRAYLYDTSLIGINPNVNTSESSRVVILRGGRRKDRSVELWIVPPGASAPKPTRDVGPKQASQ